MNYVYFTNGTWRTIRGVGAGYIPDLAHEAYHIKRQLQPLHDGVPHAVVH